MGLLAASKNRNTKIMNKTAVQQIVERLRELENHYKVKKEECYSTDNHHLFMGEEYAFEQAASIAAEFLEQEKKENPLKEKLDKFLAEVEPDFLIKEFEKLGYTFVRKDDIEAYESMFGGDDNIG